MEKFDVPTREEVSPASQQVFDNLKKIIGFVPNLYATMAYSENGLPRYLAFQNGKTSLNSKEKEAVNLVVSQVNYCRYCLSAHTAIGRMNGFSDEEILKIRRGEASDGKMAALVALAKSITVNKGRIPSRVLEDFFEAGYDKGNLVDVILQISDKIASNYLHNLTGIPIDFPRAPGLD
jgi:AhpD family alkylhydroperoxidase